MTDNRIACFLDTKLAFLYTGLSLPYKGGAVKMELAKVKTRRIIGIDPGLASSGWGIVEITDNQRVHYVSHGCVETDPAAPLAERLVAIHKSLLEILEIWKPSESGVETLYFGKNSVSAIPVAQARGVLCMTLALYGLPVRELPPSAIKQAVVGTANAEKSQVQEMSRIILGLEKIPKPNHAADALGAALCCAYSFSLVAL
jgi:crossover junction endodeoxyribonuclease RuvC